MFPFKFELKEAIVDYFEVNYKDQQQNASVSRPLIPLMATYLMFLDLADHEKVKQQMTDLKLKHYVLTPGKEVLEYIKSLPKVLYTMHMYEEDEFTLLKHLGFHFAKSIEYKHIHDHILNYITEKFPKYEVSYLFI